MGHNELRKIFTKASKWTDKTAPRHKHDFSVEACVELDSKGWITHFHVMKCKHCNSFKSIRKEWSVSGLVDSKIDSLPMIYLKCSHETLEFYGAVLDTDKYKYFKESLRGN